MDEQSALVLADIQIGFIPFVGVSHAEDSKSSSLCYVFSQSPEEYSRATETSLSPSLGNFYNAEVAREGSVHTGIGYTCNLVFSQSVG